MTETLPKIDEIREEVEEITLQILKREVNDHESKMFDLKFEYGFREQNKIQKLRGGKIIKKREKKEVINVGGGGAADKVKKEKQKGGRIKWNPNEADEEVEEEPVVKRIVEKMSMDDLMGNIAAGMAQKEKTKSIHELMAERKAKVQEDIKNGLIEDPNKDKK